ncbi:choline dehydrogenase [Pseudonocardia sp. CNS-139]|nr:choline dehydrogenase [Pseudonocardia sp. CNS-139]
METVQYDHVIVGGGSAGAVLANRLTADPTRRVLVLESGRPDYLFDVLARMPAGVAFVLGNKLYDWRYRTEPEPGMRGRRVDLPAGRLLGGSSNINGMIFQRGNPMDYEGWAAAPGMQNWSFAHVLPYLKRMEDVRAGGALRGRGGPLSIGRGKGENPLSQAFMEAAIQAGHARTEDVNGYRQEGFGILDNNVRSSRRWSSMRAYMDPARKRPNLEVRTFAHTTRILFDGKRAIGVEYADRRGHTHSVLAGEVLLSAGTIRTPQLLQLSGVGDADLLRSVGVPLVHHLPGVGQNLHDHLAIQIQHACTQPVSLGPTAHLKNAPWIGFSWLFLRRGPGASNQFEVGGFARSNDDLDYPNLMYQFLPLASKSYPNSPTTPHGYQAHVGPMRTDSRGSIRIKTPDWRDHPEIRMNYLSTERDRKEWVEAVKVTREIMRQPAFAPYDGGEAAPGPEVRTDEEIWDWVVTNAKSAMHYVGTCVMGVGDMAVTDPDTLKVHGLEGVRVIDASVIPDVTNANTYAPVMMVAERGADMALGRPQLPPDHSEYYRHQHVPATERASTNGSHPAGTVPSEAR